MKDFFEGRLRVSQGDLTAFTGDVIVNAANSGLLGGGGVDGAIHRAGGPTILEECRKIRRTDHPDGLPTGEAVATTAGDLPCRRIIHTVGPVWHGGDQGEPDLLASAYRNSLALAAREGWKTIAFPAISTGVYGYPKEEAAKIVFATLKAWLEEKDLPERMELIFFSEKDARLFTELAERLSGAG